LKLTKPQKAISVAFFLIFSGEAILKITEELFAPRIKLSLGINNISREDKHTGLRFGNAWDDNWYYAYLPSTIIDNDLDFENQINEGFGTTVRPQAQKLLGEKFRTETGLVPNKYPAGFAITLVPSFVTAHFFSLILFKLTQSPFFYPNGYSVLYILFCVLQIALMAFLMFALFAKAAADIFRMSDRSIILSVLSYLFASNYLWYLTQEPFMCHIVSGSWVAFSVYGILRYSQSVKFHWFCFSLVSFSFAIITRPTNIFLSLILAPSIWMHRREIFSNLGKYSVAVFCFIPISLQMLVWKAIYGHYVYYSYGGEGFNWLSPSLFLTLFSSNHGLFFWSPAIILSLLGLVKMVGSKHNSSISITFLLSFTALWYLNSSWHCWWFGDAYGARAFIEFGYMFLFGFAFFFESVFSYVRKSCIYLLVIILVSLNIIIMCLYLLKILPHAGYLF